MTHAQRSPTLKISEIFCSLQGETSRAGLPTVFVRLTGCPLRCVWCDSEHAFSGGSTMTLDAIAAAVAQLEAPLVCVTGGEPLAQKNCLPLLTRLCDEGYGVSLETSGALDIGGVDPRVARVVDLKAPGSGEETKNRWQNIDLLRPADEVKFVLKDRADYEWARAAIDAHGLAARCPLLFSPVQETLSPQALAEWVLEDRLPVRFQLQLHKVLWGNERGK